MSEVFEGTKISTCLTTLVSADQYVENGMIDKLNIQITDDRDYEREENEAN